MKIKGTPNKSFKRYVLKNRFARIPICYELFKTDENGEATIKEKELYPFELRRIEKNFEIIKGK